ncbi:MAG: NADH-quinone oxidoreductase subunit M, partial [candidate division Zixibacteria bacterium]|nr:NADH-quinone oxidoreductase subunit M [candidate division Zixibacteria bacterium]
MDAQILSWVVFLPLAGIPILLLLPKERPELVKWTALGVAAVDFLVSLYLPANFNAAPSALLGTSNPGMQFAVTVPWIESFGIYYRLGLDGISLFLVLLTTLLSMLAIYSTFSAINEKVKGFYISFLLLQTGMLGVFVALDVFLFYVFWEGMLIPMYFLIGIWGGPRKIYATIKFVLFTMFGSLLMLVAILALYFLNRSATGNYSFNLFDFYQLALPLNLQTWLFLAFALAFAIKVPMFPFHTWLPDAHV